MRHINHVNGGLFADSNRAFFMVGAGNIPNQFVPTLEVGIQSVLKLDEPEFTATTALTESARNSGFNFYLYDDLIYNGKLSFINQSHD
jgi:hypothetical protein